MNTAKLVFIYAAIAVFMSTTAIGICGATGFIQFPANNSAIALVTSCVGLVVTVLKAKHLFEDSEAVNKLREEHSQLVSRLKEEHSDAIIKLKQENADTVLRLGTQMKQAEIAAQQRETKLKEDNARLEMEIALRRH